MARYRHFALLIVFLIAACVTADPDPQPTEIPLDSVTSETQSGVLSSAAPAEPIDDSQAAHRAPSKNEIRIIQTRVKAAGSNPGPIVGVLGAKTRSALLAIQSGCALVKTFPLVSRQEVQTGEKPAASALPSRTRPQLAVFPSGRPSEVITANKAASNSAGDEIQLVQVRLKEAGLHPRPTDGIMGPPT